MSALVYDTHFHYTHGSVSLQDSLYIGLSCYPAIEKWYLLKSGISLLIGSCFFNFFCGFLQRLRPHGPTRRS
jgi:hypothetical protein